MFLAKNYIKTIKRFEFHEELSLPWQPKVFYFLKHHQAYSFDIWYETKIVKIMPLGSK